MSWTTNTTYYYKQNQEQHHHINRHEYCWDLDFFQQFKNPLFFIQCIALIALNFVTVAGNLMVILAVMLNKQLRSTTNLFIVSLASADMAVGFFVLPFSTTTEIVRSWLFGVVWCQIWLAMDVWLCTASIYNLLAITVDRYIAVTKPLSYRFVLTPSRASMIIGLVWILSFCICFPFMIVTWPEAFSRTTPIGQLPIANNITLTAAPPTECECTQMNNSPGYIVYSAMGSFYIPMTVICYFYFRIYRTVRKVANSAYDGFMPIKGGGGTNHQQQQQQRNGAATDLALIAPAENGSKQSTETSPILNRNNSGSNYGSPMNGNTLTTNNNSSSSNSGLLRVHKGGYKPASPCNSRRYVEYTNAQEAARYLQCPDIVAPARRQSTDSTRTHGTCSTTTESSIRCKSPRPRRVRFFGVRPITPTPSGDNNNGGGGGGNSRQSSTNSNKATRDASKTQPPQQQRFGVGVTNYGRRYQKKLSIELKALKIVGIVTGCFVACWLGFSIVYSMQAFPWCQNNNCVSATTVSVVVWLGYVNSALNPFIYAVCNQYYRLTFKRILRCTCFKFGQLDRQQRQQYAVATLCRQAGACMLVVHSSQERHFSQVMMQKN